MERRPRGSSRLRTLDDSKTVIYHILDDQSAKCPKIAEGSSWGGVLALVQGKLGIKYGEELYTTTPRVKFGSVTLDVFLNNININISRGGQKLDKQGASEQNGRLNHSNSIANWQHTCNLPHFIYLDTSVLYSVTDS